MATVKRFEELFIWQLAREQARAVFRIIHDTPLCRDEALARQINAASGSVMDNIAEGFDRFSRAEFKQFLVIARGSNAETRSQLYRIADRGYIAETLAEELQAKNKELGIKISSFLRHIQQSDYTHKPIEGKQDTVSESVIRYENDFYLFQDEHVVPLQGDAELQTTDS